MARSRKTPLSASDLRKQIEKLQRQLRAAEKREAKPPRAPRRPRTKAPAAPSAPKPRMRIRSTTGASAPRVPRRSPTPSLPRSRVFGDALRSEIQIRHDVDKKSFRTIADEMGLKKSFISDVYHGKRRASEGTAIGAIEQAKVYGATEIVTDDGVRLVTPRSPRDWQKIARHNDLLKEARRTGDFRPLEQLSRKELTIETSEGKVRLASNPDRLEEMDEEGELDFMPKIPSPEWQKINAANAQSLLRAA